MGNSAHLSEDFALHWLTERGQSHHDADLGDVDTGKSIGKSIGKTPVFSREKVCGLNYFLSICWF